MPENENPQEPGAPLPTLGEELKRQREIRGITLKEIADSTKVGKRFLEAIERDDYRTLPAPAFTRGFVREYARYLGLNPDDMVGRYMQIVAAQELAEQNEVPEYVHKFDSRPIPRSVSRVDRRVWPLVLIVVAIAAAIWFFFFRPSHSANESASSTTATAPTSTVAPPVNPSPTTTSTAVPVPASSSAPLTLHLNVTEPSWVILYADGQKLINDELPRGYDRTFAAKDAFDFKTIGNAGGIVLTLNEVQVPQLGPSGKVLHDKVLDRAFLSRLSAAAHP